MQGNNQNMNLVAKTLYGLEGVLSDELLALGASDVQQLNRAVKFKGDKKLLYAINYCSRTALSVLMPVADFRVKTKDDLYKGGMKIGWERYMDENSTFSIVPVINSPLFVHTGYAALILKDAIADYFRDKTGKRPSVNTVNPDILINLHISNEQVTVSLDSSVNPLFKRGYRQEQAVAPLNEVLAAGILMLSGWNASATLIDPMCGSGTISVEAGMQACNIPAGKFRKFWGFQRWKDYDAVMFDEIRKESDSHITVSQVKIFASDILDDAVLQTKSNLERAGLSDYVNVERADFRDKKATGDGDFIFLNPPYGERIQPEEIDELYGMIGTTLKHNFPGTTAWLITSNRDSLKRVGLKPKKKMTLFNGALECTLLKYEMYQGSKKTEQH